MHDSFRALARRWFEELRQAGPDVTEVMHDGHATACVRCLAFAMACHDMKRRSTR